MLTYYAKRSGGEGFQATAQPREYTSWVHGSAVTQAELSELVEQYGLAANIVRDVRDQDELPRIEYGDENSMYIFLRTPHINQQQEVRTTPLLVVAKKAKFFTLARGTSFRPEIVIERVSQQPASASQLTLVTVAAVINEYERLIRKTGRLVYDVGQRLKTQEVTNRDFVEFVTIEDNLNECSTSLDAIQALMQHLHENRRGIFKPHDIEMIDDLTLHIRQLLVAVASQVQSVRSIREANRTIANNSLNQRMKTLTVLTVLIALPNVFYGMYGMNVALPFAEQPWAYTVIVIFTFLIIFAVYGLARRLKIF